MEKRINIGKTYTPSILNRKSNIFREDIKKSVKKDI